MSPTEQATLICAMLTAFICGYACGRIKGFDCGLEAMKRIHSEHKDSTPER